MKELEIYPFFLTLTEEEKEQFYAYLRPITLPKNTILHYQGDICKDVLLLVEGKVRLYSQADDFSEEVTLYTLNAGEQCLANTASVLGHSKTIGTAVSETEIKAYLLNEKDIQTFMKQNPTYQQYIMSLYSKKIVELTIALQRMKFQNLDERIMDFLHENEKKIISITHQDLADKMNTSRSVVSRVLKKLENSNKLKLHRGYIQITS